MTHKLHAETRMGAVHLTTADRDRLLPFYEDIIGMTVLNTDGPVTTLGGPDGHEILVLHEDISAKHAGRTTGLYHYAILVPSRLHLARSIKRLAETQYPIQGASDHHVSEALYLADPDGNGIEIYRDRPRDQWEYPNGTIRMGTDPMDFDGVIAELEGDSEPWNGLAEGTVLGHMHLHVADIPEAQAFYTEAVGFDLILNYGGHAAFLSAGGYHHHLGTNIWGTQGAPPIPDGAVGLKGYEIVVPDQAEVDRVADHLSGVGVDVVKDNGILHFKDSSGNGIRLIAHSDANP